MDFLNELIRTIVPTIVITLSFIYLVGQLAVVCGRSMNDTLNDGDLVFIEKITQRFGELERYDIIVFDSQKDNQDFIKRIIGLPGETVKINENGDIFVNNNLIQENYGKETILYAGIAKEGITLGEKEYFVLGDNRNNSEDSRFAEIGPINYYQIKGKVFFSIIPFTKIE